MGSCYRRSHQQLMRADVVDPALRQRITEEIAGSRTHAIRVEVHALVLERRRALKLIGNDRFLQRGRRRCGATESGVVELWIDVVTRCPIPLLKSRRRAEAGK